MSRIVGALGIVSPLGLAVGITFIILLGVVMWRALGRKHDESGRMINALRPGRTHKHPY